MVSKQEKEFKTKIEGHTCKYIDVSLTEEEVLRETRHFILSMLVFGGVDIEEKDLPEDLVFRLKERTNEIVREEIRGIVHPKFYNDILRAQDPKFKLTYIDEEIRTKEEDIQFWDELEGRTQDYVESLFKYNKCILAEIGDFNILKVVSELCIGLIQEKYKDAVYGFVDTNY